MQVARAEEGRPSPRLSRSAKLGSMRDAGRSVAGGSWAGGKPVARAGADPGRQGVQWRTPHRQGWRCTRRPTPPLEVRGQDHPWVSRGGLKLDHALRHFGLSPAGRICLDIGASTGGFTDVLLAHGAARVHAVDVGHGQLAWRLRSDPRVVVHEKTNARYLTRETIADPIAALVCDASFIGLATLLPAPLATMRAGRLGDGADQAPVRGRPRCRRQQGRGARPGGSRRRYANAISAWWVGSARMASARHRREPDHAARKATGSS